MILVRVSGLILVRGINNATYKELYFCSADKRNAYD